MHNKTIKKIAKMLIYSFLGKDAKSLRKSIELKEIVSFDVYDTLVLRKIGSPDGVFWYMERKLNEEGNPRFQGFAKKRIEAERSSRMKHAEREITLDDIYDEIDFDEESRRLLMELEVASEYELAYPNEWIKEVYEYALVEKKRVFLISDMYLSVGNLDKILKKCGYRFGELIVSSDRGKTKRSGLLYDEIIEEFDLDVEKWCHIGDGIKADYLMARKKGIQSSLINMVG